MTSWNDFLRLSEVARDEQPPTPEVSPHVLQVILDGEKPDREPPWLSYAVTGTVAGAVAVSALLFMLSRAAHDGFTDPLLALSETTSSMLTP